MRSDLSRCQCGHRTGPARAGDTVGKNPDMKEEEEEGMQRNTVYATGTLHQFLDRRGVILRSDGLLSFGGDDTDCGLHSPVTLPDQHKCSLFV